MNVPQYAPKYANGKANGVVVWEGPSRIDGSPIVCVATGLKRPSDNPKTGPMVQTWILRSDQHPVEALQTGGDVGICGGCTHRPSERDGESYSERSCYVNIMGPSSIYRAYVKGAYPRVSEDEIPAVFEGRDVRLGAYGDPAAVPLDVWDRVLALAAGHTGYTHQWRNDSLRDALKYCQLSADSRADAEAAREAGVGSFRVLREGEDPLPGEMLCPASAEAGFQTTCAECQACTGMDGAQVYIRAHGKGSKYYDDSKPRSGKSLPILNPNR